MAYFLLLCGMLVATGLSANDDSYLLWAHDFGGSKGAWWHGRLALDIPATMFVSVPAMASPPLFPSMFGKIIVTIQSTRPDHVNQSCINVTTSGGCFMRVCNDPDWTKHYCFDDMPWSSTPSTYELTVTQASSDPLDWVYYSINIAQTCTGGGWVDEYACIPPVGVPQICVGKYNDPNPGPPRAWFGLGGCDCDSKCGIEFQGGFCCWDGSTPANMSGCGAADPTCQYCGGGNCPGGSAATSTVTGSRSPSPSQSPGSAAAPPASSGYRLGALTGPAAYTVAAVIGVCVLAVFVGIAVYFFRRGRYDPVSDGYQPAASEALQPVSVVKSVNSGLGDSTNSW